MSKEKNDSGVPKLKATVWSASVNPKLPQLPYELKNLRKDIEKLRTEKNDAWRPILKNFE